MKKRKIRVSNKYRVIFLVLLCLILIGLSIYSGSFIKPFRAVAEYTIIPMQKGFGRFGTFVSSQMGEMKTVEDLQKENEELRAQVEKLTEENQKLQLNTNELTRLQELYNLDQYYTVYDTIGARVIGKDSGNWFNTFIIDKGSRDGIRKDMNVIASGGLVGIVTEVGDNHATVRSIIDDESRVSAMTAYSSDLCIVSGDLTLIDEGRIAFGDMANNDNEVKAGDAIVTSHISGKYVPGILIGYVTEVQINSSNLTRSGYLTPAVSFDHLHEVLVITNLKSEMSQSDVDSIVANGVHIEEEEGGAEENGEASEGQ